MKRALFTAAAAAVLALAFAGVATADEGKKVYKKKYAPQVRGYVERRGGYSYSYADSIDTYGSSRTVTGGSRFYRDSYLDRQSRSGPFDHGFFFDSGIAPRGGDSPYMH